jgi:hypothetical protein
VEIKYFNGYLEKHQEPFRAHMLALDFSLETKKSKKLRFG